jgi:hypothetical protein
MFNVLPGLRVIGMAARELKNRKGNGTSIGPMRLEPDNDHDQVRGWPGVTPAAISTNPTAGAP